MEFKNFEPTVEEFWQGPARPAFLNPSGTKFYRAPLKMVLSDRGLSNRLLDSLLSALPSGAVIAGGFMTSVIADQTDASDVDLFFTSAEAFNETVRRLQDPTSWDDFDAQDHWAIEGYKLDEASEKLMKAHPKLDGVRFLKFVHEKRLPIQLIKLAWYESAEAVIDSFDLTVAQFAADVATGELVANPLSFLDVARKRLVLHRMQFPSSTLRRVIKYSKKGYYACPGSLGTIAAAIAAHIQFDDAQYVYID